MKKIIMDILHDFAIGETNIRSEADSVDTNDVINANSPYNDGWTQQYYKDKLSKNKEEYKGGHLG